MKIDEDLYDQILNVIPIPCVDILLEDRYNRIFLLKRINEPAQDAWWFPGGRVYFAEKRIDAAKRIAFEECGVEIKILRELTTLDAIINYSKKKKKAHGITTLYHAKADDIGNLQLDSQSSNSKWLPTDIWLEYDLHPFIQDCLQLFLKAKLSDLQIIDRNK